MTSPVFKIVCVAAFASCVYSLRSLSFDTVAAAVSKTIGPIAKGNLNQLRGGGLPTHYFDHLTCEFKEGERCCWVNGLNGNDDTFDWVVVNANPNKVKATRLLRTKYEGRKNFKFDLPESGFLAAAAPKSPTLDYAILASCPVSCMQGPPGNLTFDYWLGGSATLDVCTLPIGSIRPENCMQTTNTSTKFSYPVPPGDMFSFVLIASEFERDEGDIVAIDNIFYEGELC